MTDLNQIRINELARELEVKAKAIIDYLPEAGVTEKKTHSSSIDVDAAERVRKHFRDAAEEEAAVEQKAVAEKAAKEAAAKAARMKPAVVAPPAALPIAAAPHAPAAVEHVPPVAPTPPVPVVPKPVAPAVIAAKPATPVSPVPVKSPPLHPATPAKPAARPAVTIPAPPSSIAPQAPAVAKPAASARTATSAAGSARHATTAHPTSSAKSAPKPNWNPLPPGARVNPPAPVRPRPVRAPALRNRDSRRAPALQAVRANKSQSAPDRRFRDARGGRVPEDVPLPRCLRTRCLPRQSPVSQSMSANLRRARVPQSRNALKRVNASCTPSAPA